MSARRCSNCGIDYPPEAWYSKCKACGGDTSWFSNMKPDPNWKDAVELALAPPVEFPDKRTEWRYDQLRRAGYEIPAAIELSTTYEVDLHHAVDLADRAGPDLAYAILA